MASEMLILVGNPNLIEVKLKAELVSLALIAEIIANKDETFFQIKKKSKEDLKFLWSWSEVFCLCYELLSPLMRMAKFSIMCFITCYITALNNQLCSFRKPPDKSEFPRILTNLPYLTSKLNFPTSQGMKIRAHSRSTAFQFPLIYPIKDAKLRLRHRDLPRTRSIALDFHI